METGNVKNEASKSEMDPEDETENPLLNLCVLTSVFKNLDTSDLLRCSGVNKLWFREARRLLRSHRVYARPRYSYPCHSLKKLDKFLNKIKPEDILYNGLYLQFDTWHCKESWEGCENKYDENLGCHVAKEIPYTNILSKLQLKYLKLNWRNRSRLEYCPTALIVPELLVHHGETLEEIEIENGPCMPEWLFHGDALGSGRLWLPKLKVLQAKPLEYRVFEADTILPLIQVAPNLEDLLVCVSSKEIRSGIIPKDPYKIIKSLCFERRRIRDLATYSEFASTCPELYCLILQDYTHRQGTMLNRDDSSDDSDDDDGEDEEPFWEVFEKVLESTQEYLEMIRVPLFDFASQVSVDSNIFPNVTLLVLEIPSEAITQESYIHEILFDSDSVRFPYLAEVRFETPPRRVSTFPPFHEDVDDVEAHESQLSIFPEYPWTTVRSLTLNHHVTDFSLEYCAALFPNLTQLDVGSTKANMRVPYEKIWTEFRNLEMLSVREPFWGQHDAEDVNYDADFLGIFEDEAEDLRKNYLRNKDLKHVKNMHIVPIKPCILTAKNLQKVTISFLENWTLAEVENGHFFLSPAACVLIKHQMPQLKLKLVCYMGNFALETIEDYVEVEEL